MTSDHLRIVPDTHLDARLLCKLGEQFSGAETPDFIVAAIRLERMTATEVLEVGDIVRRLVARTTAQQMSDVVEAATAPYQCALSTRAGTECIAHALQLLTEENPRATVLSIDGIGDIPEVNGIDEGGRQSSHHAICQNVLRPTIVFLLGRR